MTLRVVYVSQIGFLGGLYKYLLGLSSGCGGALAPQHPLELGFIQVTLRVVYVSQIGFLGVYTSDS